MTLLTEIDGLTAADVMHGHLSTLPVTTTVGELRDYFAQSSSRRLAVFADGDRYAGSIGVGAVADDVDAAASAADHAMQAPVIGPGASASEARDLALAQPSRRVPVVEPDGTLRGVVAIDKQLEKFCS